MYRYRVIEKEGLYYPTKLEGDDYQTFIDSTHTVVYFLNITDAISYIDAYEKERLSREPRVVWGGYWDE